VTAAGATAAVAALILAGCGSGGGGTTAAQPTGAVPKPQKDAKLAAMVPAAIAKDGTVTIGTDATYAPGEFLAPDGKTVVGLDVDLFDAVAAKLGLKTKWTPAPFDNIIPGVLSNKYEAGVSSFTINPDRKKQVNMVEYFNAGIQWFTKKGNPKKVDPANACGKNIAVQRGTVEVPDLNKRSKACTKAGKKGISVHQYQGQDQATAAVVSGKEDASSADSPVAAYAVKQTNGQVQLLGGIYEAAPYGFVVNKSETKFADAISKAAQAIITDGTYKKILDKWKAGAGAVSKTPVNP
jgi:polar amino acid transport system substrate-binding protein